MKSAIFTNILVSIIVILCSCSNERTKKKDYYSVFHQAQEHYSKSEFLLALSMYDEVKDHVKHPVLDTLNFNRGICNMEVFNFELALSDFFTSVKNGYRVPDALHNIGLCYYAMNCDSMAVKYFQETLKIDKNNLVAKDMLLKLGNP